MKRSCFLFLTLLFTAALLLGLTSCSDNTVEQLQNEAGAILEGGSFEKGAVLNTSRLAATDPKVTVAFEKLEGLGISSFDRENALIYDISVTKNGKEVQPVGAVTLTFPLSAGAHVTGFQVYHMDDGGSLTTIPSTYANGKVSFKTDHFSLYIFIPIEEKATGLKLDAKNAGFTYLNDQLTTTVYQIGDKDQPKVESILVYATYPTKQDKELTLGTDYTRELGGLDLTQVGTYTVTYTLASDPAIRATLTVQVVARPLSNGATNEAEWKQLIDYTDKTNVKIVGRYSSPNDPADLGAQIMIYQFNGTAYSEDGYFEKDENSQKYEGKATYLVKSGNEYAYIYWGYVGDSEGWEKNTEPLIQEMYTATVENTIYGRLSDYKFADLSYDASTKTYKNSDESVKISFTFENDKVTKIVVVEFRASDSMTATETITFGNATVEVPTVK